MSFIVPAPLNLTGIEAFRIFLSKLQPVNGSKEIWLKLGHNQFFVGEYDLTGEFEIAATKLDIPGDRTSRIRTRIYSDCYKQISHQCFVQSGGAFFLPSQPIGLPLKANVKVSDDIAAELDSGTATEQWQRIWEFVEITGLYPSYIVHSGGKSYHPHWKLHSHIAIEQTIRLRKLIAIALHSDPAVINPHQPMRLPGFYRQEKGQFQALSYHSEHKYSKDDFEARLAHFYRHRGWPYPEVLSQKHWSECRRIIILGDLLSDRVYQQLLDRRYQLPEVVEKKQLTYDPYKNKEGFNDRQTLHKTDNLNIKHRERKEKIREVFIFKFSVVTRVCRLLKTSLIFIVLCNSLFFSGAVTPNIKTLVLAEAIGENVKNCEIKRILNNEVRTQESVRFKSGVRSQESGVNSTEIVQQSLSIDTSNKSKAANLAEKNKSETKKLLTPDSLTPESALLTSKNPWVEFYQQKIIPAIVSLESAFDLFPHNFVRNCYDRLDGDPGYRSSSGGQSFTVSWRDGQPVYRDWKEAESGDLVKYYWRSRGYSGYPRGKDYIEIVKEIAARHNISVPNELTRSIEEPDEREYQQYLKWEEEQEIVDRYLDEQKFIYWLNNEFITWLKAQKNKLSKKFKGFVTKDLENTAIAPDKDLPETIEYLPGNPLPTPELYQEKEPPKICFKKGDRLSLIFDLKQKGWRRVWDSSQMGLGKSHDTGLLAPDPESKNKIWYLDNNHRNVSTISVKEKYTDLEPRHDGQIWDESRLRVGKNKEEKENAVIKSNCHLADLFVAFKQKHWDFENDRGDNKAPNPICGNCRYHKKKALNERGEMVALCSASRGEGYGYRFERRETLSQRQIRASVYSLPTPVIDGDRSDERGDRNYDYSGDIAFLEEASQIKGIKTIKVSQSDFDRALIDLSYKAPELFDRLRTLLFPIRQLFAGHIPLEHGNNPYGWGHNVILDLLGKIPSDLADLIATLKEGRRKREEGRRPF